MNKANKTVTGGLVVIFEGLDGVGKTTQLKLAQTALEEQGYSVHPTRNLGGSPIGEELRQVMLGSSERTPATGLYISVAIQEALVEVIKEKRSQGSVILLDRGPMSMVAYQSYGENLDQGIVWKFGDEGIDKLQPEQIILFDMPVAAALKRATDRSSVAKADYYESKPLSYFENVRSLLVSAANKFGAKTIDANQTIEQIHASTMTLINQAMEDKLKA
jgi:dTMP kinase